MPAFQILSQDTCRVPVYMASDIDRNRQLRDMCRVCFDMNIVDCRVSAEPGRADPERVCRVFDLLLQRADAFISRAGVSC